MSAPIPAMRVKPLSELVAAPYNPRVITDEAMAGLQASIDRFGLVQPVVWNERTGHVVGGHQRIKVLEQSGATETQVVVVDLPESEEKALNITLNNPHIAGEFTLDVLPLLDELEELDPEEFEALQLGGIREPLPDGGVFAPTIDPDPRLDQKAPIVCPHCGEEFTL